MKKSIKSIVVLVCICVCVASLMAVTNYITAPIIEKNAQGQADAALLELLPTAESFELMDLSAYELPATVREIHKATPGGYVVKLETTGYASGMVIMCGISADGEVVGTKLLASGETPSIGGSAIESFAPALVGKTADDVDTVDTVAGATKTTAAYRAAIKDALSAVKILGGETVEFRTEEEIFLDNLAAVLPAAEKKFAKPFIAEIIEGVDEIYAAQNGSGYVVIIGEAFIGADADGKVITECSDADKSAAETAIAKINSTKTTDIDLTLYEGVSNLVASAKITESGNYILEVKGEGYSKFLQQYSGVGEYILIRVSMTADGKIIDTYTVSHMESKGIGDACANESFYGQFDGKTEANYADVDAIGGATLTTNGYKEAILRAFNTLKILTGGNA